jgi:hypothetical protein
VRYKIFVLQYINMTDTKIVVSRINSNRIGSLVASYKNIASRGLFTVVSIRTLSALQDGSLAFKYGVTDVTYAPQEMGGLYSGTISSIVSTISDHVYTLELSNIFGNPANPTIVYDTSSTGNVRELIQPVVYTTTMIFNQASVAEFPLVFSFDYTGPTNTVQLNFYTLLLNTSNTYQKSGDPTYFVV